MCGDEELCGEVIRATGSWYDVVCDGRTVRCRIRGKLRLKGVRTTNPVVVGDVVRVECGPEGDPVISAVCPRRNYVIRRASNLSKEAHIIAANVDRALLLATLFDPETPREFIDRFLLTCEAYRIPATVVLAKCDLARRTPEAMADFVDTYRGAGYEVVELAALEDEGVGRIRELVAGGTTLVAGNSGVGKSTLIGKIDPTFDPRTGEISESSRKGCHTTTFSTVYTLPDGGRIIDTPGIKGFGLIDIDNTELWHYFREMIATAGECRFYNCTHTHEPGCAVREAVEAGRIAWSRYESYLKIMDEDEKYRK